MNELRAKVRQLGGDHRSGASQLLPRVVGILIEARGHGRQVLLETASHLCAAQPSMASVWNAVLAALASTPEDDRLAAFARRAERGASALVRVAVEALSREDEARPLRLVTHSASGSVQAVIRALAASDRVEVECSEGRPVLEGRDTATALADAGVTVRFWTDGALLSALDGADAVLLGADAVTPSWFINKTGSSGLAAAASLRGVPVFVLASRDKFVPQAVGARLEIVDHDSREVWDPPPDTVQVRNPYFERVPLGWASAFVTDAGLIGPDDVEEVCRANGSGVGEEILEGIRVGSDDVGVGDQGKSNP